MAPPLPARVGFFPWQEWSASGVFPQWVDYLPRGTDERELVHLRLAGLSPATRYAHRVVLQEGKLVHESPVGSFYTTPGPGTRWPSAFSLTPSGEAGPSPTGSSL